LIFSICAAEFGDYVLAGMNISLFLFNILPLKPLDGGRMIYAVTAWIWDSDRAEKAVKVCSVIVIVALSISAIVFRKWVFVYFTLVACKISGNGVKFQVKRRNDLRNRG